ncbi:hypothetical protein CSKR_112584 [Clonorchis sinensis]|uniref:Uncharacterized protein n=1 Tax=Clonorchis sinensis TaxID=79923 RepID=A0A3R7G233_CLOSI|nr:hypothetical protein CSKR_112584 [Clonorchis sinensis]
MNHGGIQTVTLRKVSARPVSMCGVDYEALIMRDNLIRHIHNRTRCRLSLLLKINTKPIFMRTDEYETSTEHTNLI